MRVCNVPGCPTIFDGTGGRCPAHAQAARAKRVDNKPYSTKAHQDFRTSVLRRDRICVIPGCSKRSTVADHYPRTRRELVALNADPNDPQYGRGLCTHHHNTHTARTSPGGWHAQR